MRRRALLGWIPPVLIVAALGVYGGGVATGRWDPNPTVRSDANAAPFPESTDPEQRRARAELCPLINRPDVYERIERPVRPPGVGTSYLRDNDIHECNVTLPSSVLRLSVAHDRLRVADYLRLFPEAQPRTVLGRPAMWTTGHSLVVHSPWQEATLMVAWDRADSGGSAELTVLRGTLDPGDEATLTEIAERQLPVLPGWPG